MIRNLVLKALQRWKKSREKYYVLNFFHGNSEEIAIVRLEGNNNGGIMHGQVLTERELLPDLAQISTSANSAGIWHNGLKRPCDHAMLEVLRNHTRQIKPEQATEIQRF